VLAKQNLRRLFNLSAYSPHNYGNKVSLLEAEISVAEGKFHQARLKYENSIAQASEAKLWSEVGLACERMSFALLKRKRLDDALNYLDQAASAYERWGATAKVLEIRSSASVDGLIQPRLAEELVALSVLRKL
jgi:predicted negative regulator of RcsB-dependent stress response